jgi:hypothetical protein
VKTNSKPLYSNLKKTGYPYQANRVKQYPYFKTQDTFLHGLSTDNISLVSKIKLWLFSDFSIEKPFYISSKPIEVKQSYFPLKKIAGGITLGGIALAVLLSNYPSSGINQTTSSISISSLPNLKIICENSKKTGYIKEAISSIQQKGFDLSQLKEISVSPQADRRDSLSFFKNVAVYKHGAMSISALSTWDWDRLAFARGVAAPTWKKNLYSGSPSHVICHEIGHHLHFLKLDEERAAGNYSYRQSFTQGEKDLIKKEMGHSHFLKSTELVAEMFAGLIAGKKFSPALCKLYKECCGPLPPSGKEFPGFSLIGVTQ